MLKNLVNTLIILLAAGLIALGWYAFSTTAAGQTMEPSDRPAEFIQMDKPTSSQIPAADMSEDLPVRPEGDEMGFSLSRILIGMAANVGITALAIFLIVWLRKLVNRLASIPFKFVWIKGKETLT